MELTEKLVYVEKVSGGKDGQFHCTVSDPGEDRDGDIVDQHGWSTKLFNKNPVLLFGHGMETRIAVGSVDAIGVTDKSGNLEADFHFNVKTTLGKELFELYNDRDMRAVSPGFMGQKVHRISEGRGDMKCERCLSIKNPKEEGFFSMPRHFVKQEMWELSACAIPANASALTSMRKAAARLNSKEAWEFVEAVMKFPGGDQAETAYEELLQRINKLEEKIEEFKDSRIPSTTIEKIIGESSQDTAARLLLAARRVVRDLKAS